MAIIRGNISLHVYFWLGITGLEKKEVSDDVMEVNYNENGENNEDGEEDSEVSIFSNFSCLFLNPNNFFKFEL